MMRALMISLGLGTAVAITGCSYSDIPFAYEVPVQQGNIITEEMIAELEPGMTRRQVQFVLGTPAIEDIFRDDRWDYIHTEAAGGGGRPDRLTVFFDGDRLVRVEGNLAPEDFGS
ncbi:outer membrane protein assembly factor BamE [Aquisalimonas sp.]|uniref:outer membrane protein assembly factor BamE n=1 Tax=unclassified Aquisalimonas TaxID=2644645 RepID=UPI0025C4D751|nr:outer membrane protein assembly factor BamE [Aquisalimonas sp.]